MQDRDDIPKSLLTARFMATPVEELSPEELVAAYAAMGALEKLSKSRKEQIRGLLIEIADQGLELDSGTKKIRVEGSILSKEKRTGSIPDEEKVALALSREGIPLEEAFDRTSRLVLNPSKLDHLIDRGRIDGDEIAGYLKTSYAVKVAPSRDLRDRLELITARFRDLRRE